MNGYVDACMSPYVYMHMYICVSTLEHENLFVVFILTHSTEADIVHSSEAPL